MMILKYFNPIGDRATIEHNPNTLFRQIEEQIKTNTRNLFLNTLSELGMSERQINDEIMTYKRIGNAIAKEMDDGVTGVLEALIREPSDTMFQQSDKDLEKVFNRTINSYLDPLKNKESRQAYRKLISLNGVSYRIADSLYVEIYPDHIQSLDRMASFIEFEGLRHKAANDYALWMKEDEIIALIKKHMLEDYFDDIEKFKMNVAAVLKDPDLLREVKPPEVLMTGERAYADTRIYNEMKRFFEHIFRLQAQDEVDKQERVDELDAVNDIVSEVEKKYKFSFSNDQKQAVQAFWQNKILILTGEAGSGKTTTVRAINEVVRRLRPEARLFGASFTGRASFNLARLADYRDGEWSTLHKLQAVNRFSRDFDGEGALPKYEDIDVLIIEEFSMISLQLINSVIPKLKESAKIVFVGDLKQLPAITVGFAFDYSNSNVSEWINLREVQRQDKSSHLYRFINAIDDNEVDVDELNKLANNELEYQDFKFITANGERSMVNNAVREYFRHLRDVDNPKTFNNKDAQLGMRVVATTNRVVNRVNELLQMRLREHTNIIDSSEHIVVGSGDSERYFYKGDRVVINKNIGGTMISNGMGGRIIDFTVRENVRYDLEKNETYLATGGIPPYYISEIIVEFDDLIGITTDNIDNGVYKFDAHYHTLNYLTLGYASTIHKVQGMTLETVIFPLVHSAMNSKQIAYTAISRASKHATLITSTPILRDTINYDVYRNARTLYHDILTNS